MNSNKAVIFILVSFCITLVDAFPQQHQLPETDGSISGVVVLSPKSSPVRFGGGLYGRSGSSESSQPSSDSVLVALISSERQTISGNDKPIILDQKDNTFVPKLLPIQQNQEVRIRNSDPVFHNVFSLSSTKKFDVGRRPKGEYLDVKFDKSGVVDVFCDIHSNMHAVIYILPLNAKKWMKVESGQTFNFEQVPSGSYELKIYARGYEEISMPVEISSGEDLQLGTITMNS